MQLPRRGLLLAPIALALVILALGPLVPLHQVTAPALARLRFPLVPAPFEGRPWFLPFVGEWFRLNDRLAARGRR